MALLIFSYGYTEFFLIQDILSDNIEWEKLLDLHFSGWGWNELLSFFDNIFSAAASCESGEEHM